MRRWALAAALAALVWPPAASAREIWSSADGERTVELRSALRTTGLLSWAPDDPLLYPERASGASLWRLRLDLSARPVSWLTAAVAYENRVRLSSAAAGLGGGGGFLPSQTEPAFRLRSIDAPIVDRPTLSWRHELDRASVAVRLAFGSITLGRQAVGWGRGALFGAVDVFAPFSPLEVDREWRRGIDAVRAEVRFGGRLSADAVLALGERWDDSALAARLRGYFGDVDAELVGGRRGTDLFGGLTASAAVGGAELHGELALFRLVDPWPDGGTFGDDRLVAKAVVGGSYQIDVGEGLRVVAEYHYSGFGARDPRQLTTLLLAPEFAGRLSRGDTQILGRHAIAVLLAYPVSPTTSAALTWMQDPADGSGLVGASLSWDAGDRVTLVATGYVAYGAPPEGLSLQSQFGAVPITGLVQLRLYD